MKNIRVLMMRLNAFLLILNLQNDEEMSTGAYHIFKIR